jgi:hypothetical protein
MTSVRRHRLFTAALATACLIAPPASNAAQKSPAAGPKSHDGVYVVEVQTRQGSCDRAYRWTISVAGGRVSAPRDAMMQALGQISPKGSVSLTFRRDQHVARASGRVDGRSGSGTWVSPTLQCAGSWRAARQG